MRILLVEPFYGGSHRVWADGVVAGSAHDVVLVTEPDERWRWRLQGGSLSLGEAVVAAVAEHGPPDVVVVSDMVDLPALLGFARRAIGSAPVVAYFHENQLLYPLRPDVAPDRRAALTNWLSLCAADLVLFNSHFHREALLAALPAFVDRLDDDGHRARLEGLAARGEVVPVGVDLTDLRPERRPARLDGPPVVVWNHRWEWDKQVEVALRLLADEADEGTEFGLVLAGERPPSLPEPVPALLERLRDRIVVDGHLPRDEYVRRLREADVVLSTATQEFFGIAVVEAMAAGCVPVLPRDLSYPEVVPDRWHGAALHDREGSGPADHLHRVLTDVPAARAAVDGLAESMQRFDLSVVAPALDARLERLAGDGRVS